MPIITKIVIITQIMKRIVIAIVAAALLSSCATLKPQPRQTVTRLLDFRPYSEAGFYISGDPYPEAHTPIGNIYIEVDPALIPNDAPQSYSDIYRERREPVIPEIIPIDELLDEAVSQALQLGADGICNLKIMEEERFMTIGKVTTTFTVKHYTITGTCIKIK